MSDVGVYAATRAEIAAAFSTPPIEGVGVDLSISLEKLINVDGMRKPCLGVVFASSRRLEDKGGTSYAVGDRRIRAMTQWTVIAVWQDMRGSAIGTPDLDGLCEIVRDRLHGLKSALQPTAKYTWEHESPIDVPSKAGVIVRGIGFRLPLMLGN